MTFRALRWQLGCWLVMLGLAACAPAAASPRPPEILYGRDACEQCGMIISDARYAAATIVEPGEPHKFESIGDMVLYHTDHPDQKVRAWFVHAYNTETWIRAETAFYVWNDRRDSPMLGGPAAFETQTEAESLAASLDTRVLNFDEMRVAVHLALHGN